VTLPVKAVLFDWRGTLVVSMSLSAWVEHTLQQTGCDSSPDAVAGIRVALAQAMEHPAVQRTWDRVDESTDVHRETYARVFRVAGLDDGLGDALYAIESDPAYNRVADNVPDTLTGLKTAGVRVGSSAIFTSTCDPPSPTLGWRISWTASCSPSSTASRSQP
jgi:phosphoglycolate phosphatase-like HAD superfamily hydrolase